MSILATSTPLGRELLGHLDEQLRSVGRLKSAVLALGEAVRNRDVGAVIRHTGVIEAETTFRGSLEERRTALLVRGAGLLGVQPYEVTVSALCVLVGIDEARTAQERSALLMEETDEVAREHACNRALMQQELAFLDHLLRLGGAPAEATYDPPAGARPGAGGSPSAMHHVLDLRA
jgi:hypothetical protein